MKKMLTAMILVIAVVFVFTGCNITPEPDTYTVIFDSNGGSMVNSIENVKSGSKLQKPDDPEYAGYDFKGWYRDNNLTELWDWGNDVVTTDITLYARWQERVSVPEPDTYTVTFDSNGGTAVNSIENVESGSKLQKPNNPEHAGYDFKGWYKDINLTELWDWGNDIVTTDITLYAKWVERGPSTYVFEAEDTYLGTTSGPWGWGGGSPYPHYLENVGASGDRFPFGLYELGTAINFYLVSDKNIDDVIFVARLSAEIMDMEVNSDMFEISINGTPILYEPISFTGVPQFIYDGKVRCIPFEDYTIATNMPLKKGENHIRFMPIKEYFLPGTTVRALSPLIDCVKLTTKATVSLSASQFPKVNF